MPYLIRHTKSGSYEVVKRATGEVVAHSHSKQGARGYIWHAMKGEPKVKKERTKKK